MMPSRNNHPMMPMARLATISPQTRYTYVLRKGALMLVVCLVAFHTVRKPKPKVNPAAIPAILKSPTEDAIFVDGEG